MEIKGSITDRARTAAILLTGVIPLVLQPGPVAGEAVAERHLDRLLDERPDGEGDLPDDVALQCHLISLISDAVTLRALEMSEQAAGKRSPKPNMSPAGLGLAQIDTCLYTRHSESRFGDMIIQPPAGRSPHQPRGP